MGLRLTSVINNVIAQLTCAGGQTAPRKIQLVRSIGKSPKDFWETGFAKRRSLIRQRS